MMRLTAEQAAAIRRQGEQGYPLEQCGVLLGDREEGVSIVREARPLPNAESDRPETAFSIAPDTLRDLMREERQTGRQILGFYHSHPDAPACPSETDRLAAWEGWATVIVSVRGGSAAEMTAWHYDEAQAVFYPETLEI